MTSLIVICATSLASAQNATTTKATARWGAWIECETGQWVVGICGSGGNPDCPDKSTNQVQCAATNLTLTNAPDRTTKSWGESLECGTNEVARGMCGSGANPDCTGGVTNGLKCAKLPDSRELVDSVWSTSNFGQVLSCPSGMVATGLCGSGRNADCSHNNTKVVNRLKCAKVKDLSDECAQLKTGINNFRSVPNFDGDACMQRLTTCSRSAIQDCTNKRTELQERARAANEAAAQKTFLADPANRLVSRAAEANGQLVDPSCPAGQVLDIVEATYGAGLPNISVNNVLHDLAPACAFKQSCRYTIDTNVLGDKAPGVAKSFLGKFRCRSTADAAKPCFQYWYRDRVKRLHDNVMALATQYELLCRKTTLTAADKRICQSYKEEVTLWITKELGANNPDTVWGVGLTVSDQLKRTPTLEACGPPARIFDFEATYKNRLNWANTH